MPDGASDLHAVMGFGNLDVPVGPERLGGALDELGEQRDPERRIGRAKDRDRFRRFRDRLVGVGIEAGGADQDGDRGGHGAVEARPQRRRRGEVDQHVAMLLVERKAGIVSDRRGDRPAHAAVGRDEADPDWLVGGAHDKSSWRKGERRAMRAALPKD